MPVVAGHVTGPRIAGRCLMPFRQCADQFTVIFYDHRCNGLRAFIFAGRHLLKDWTVMDRLGEITVPTLVMAGSYDFVFPPECQRELAAGIPNARRQLIDRAGHNPHSEQTATVMAAVRRFLSSGAPRA
jgi:pimeloyl-ACP methyl ester carboxylesterase